jgi:hypothetical protein
MKSKTVKITEVKVNPNNPRLIKDDKFKKLVQSIKDFPEMLNIRPIVVNSDMIVLGGNMRLKACKEAGLKEVPIIVADNLTEEQQREFLIKDNTSGGEWDWDMIANEWDAGQLGNWGLDFWQPDERNWNDVENKKDSDELEGYLNRETGILKLSFLQEQYKEVIKKLDKIQAEQAAKDHSETFLLMLEKYEDLRNKKN